MTHSTKRLTALLTMAIALAVSVGGWPAARTAAQGQPTKDGQHNQLTDAEKKAGWKLLFDGTTLKGWHSFKKEGVRPGWQVKDGELVCAIPSQAGDIVTDDQYDWFELSVEFNMTEKGNSGIMFRVANSGKTTWTTGPEIQLQDNLKGTDPQKCGWIYQIYKPENDPATNKPLDATKPVGQWNHLRFVLAPPPAKSEVDMNGVKYFDFVFQSDDWNARVAASKFKKETGFAKAPTGFLALQGDHGSVSFRNIKLRPITATDPAKK